ncbi:hypothetical protein BRARA_H00534 [Brassica rapa]|uniref:Uncharacterized protein n=1 Tax=Brassica campestris TaxID=3711 RepID=A0A397YGF7_BRACM|nr:hypothetical protein BRARA_H00534 [Brassica rapa]
MTTFKATSAQWQNHRWKGVSVALSVFDGLSYEFHKKLAKWLMESWTVPRRIF